MCPRCGKVSKPEDRFCGFCGYNLTVANTSDFVTKQDLNLNDIKFDLAMVYFKEKKYKQALDLFEKVIEKHPDNLQVMNMLDRTREILEQQEWIRFKNE